MCSALVRPLVAHACPVRRVWRDVAVAARRSVPAHVLRRHAVDSARTLAHRLARVPSRAAGARDAGGAAAARALLLPAAVVAELDRAQRDAPAAHRPRGLRARRLRRAVGPAHAAVRETRRLGAPRLPAAHRRTLRSAHPATPQRGVPSRAGLQLRSLSSALTRVDCLFVPIE